MDSTVEALVVDLLHWVALRERSYEEVMAAWRTSCPKLPVWEDASDQGLVVVEHGMVRVTAEGQAFLAQHQRPPRSNWKS